MTRKISIAKRIAPEDIRAGSYVIVIAHVGECARWPCDAAAPEKARIRWTPSAAPKPLRVVDVCLPVVLVENEQAESSLLDVRVSDLARVPARFAESVWERARIDRERSKEGSKSADETICV